MEAALQDGLFTPSHRGGSGPPLVCLHGITDTWRSWELVLPALERRHDVLAPTLAGHAGGPPLEEPVTGDSLADAVERAMDEAGFETAHFAGNSLGGFLSLQLASRGRARSVVALAPAGGWADAQTAFAENAEHFLRMQELVKPAVPHADAIVATDGGRRAATRFTTKNYEHIPRDLLAHQIRGVAGCVGLPQLIEYAGGNGWSLDAESITCPVRVVWGTGDLILPWPTAAARFRQDWIPNAEWIELDGIGHCPQLDVPVEVAQLISDFAND